MKKHHATIVLFTIFMTLLCVLWWAEYAGIPNSQEAEANRAVVLPELQKVDPNDIRRIEITQNRQGDEPAADKPNRLVFERRDDTWQMVEPVNAAADPIRVETLARNLKHLVKTPEAGTINDPPEKFGLAPPAATLKVYGSDKGKELAGLDIGKAVRDRLYVRPTGKPGIEVIDSRLFQIIGEPAPKWRDTALINLATFQINALEIDRPGHSLKVERSGGKWRLVTPVSALADDFKVDEVLGEITSLRVLDGAFGFVADDVRDLAPFGLDTEHALQVTITPALSGAKPQTLLIGKPAPDREGRVYAKRADQDDVVLVSSKGLGQVGVDPNALRSKRIADFDPNLAAFIRIKDGGQTFDLSRSTRGWTILEPVKEPADEDTVSRLLRALTELEASVFFEPAKVASSNLDPPAAHLELWQVPPGERLRDEPAIEPKGKPSVNLALGRHDVGKRSVFGRSGSDATVFAIPDAFLSALPENILAFRDRSVLHLSLGLVSRVTVERDGQTYIIDHPKTGDPNAWALEAPVTAPANNEAVTKALVILSNLRAERLITDAPGVDAQFGLDRPTVRVTWESAGEAAPSAKSSTASLLVGARVPRTESWFARLSTGPRVFTVADAAVLPFREEFRNTRVVSFNPKLLERMTLKWPDRALTFKHQTTARGGVLDWEADPSNTGGTIDLLRISALANDVAKLQTRKYIQHTGALPDAAGLDHPRLEVDIAVKGRADPIRLRVGNDFDKGEYYATIEPSDSGTVFVLTGPGWSALVPPQGAARGPVLPADVFAPAAPKTP